VAAGSVAAVRRQAVVRRRRTHPVGRARDDGNTAREALERHGEEAPCVAEKAPRTLALPAGRGPARGGASDSGGPISTFAQRPEAVPSKMDLLHWLLQVRTRLASIPFQKEDALMRARCGSRCGSRCGRRWGAAARCGPPPRHPVEPA
jgi:hypothetical protein